MNRLNYVNQMDVRRDGIQEFLLLTVYGGVSFTLLLTYSYGNSPQGPLNRKQGRLQHWSEIASTEKKS